MGRVATLEPARDSAKNRWYVSLPPRLSPTGKRKREYFASKREAEDRAKRAKQQLEQSASLVRKAGPVLIEAAVTYDELFQIYGFNGLKEACEQFADLLEKEHKAVCFGALVDRFEADHRDDWSKPTLTTWNWLRKHLRNLEDRPVAALDTVFWVDWISRISKREKWSPTTFNDVAKRISGVWRHARKQGVVKENPLDGVKRRKKHKTAVAILEIPEARLIMETAWYHDRELVPYFAIALFAGLRPESELTKLTWEDVNFEERWIRVNFGNKTDTKRFVPIEDNLMSWLKPWKNEGGSILPQNLVRRRRYVVRGKYQSSPGAKANDWSPVAEWVRDITRHSYGSYLEGKYKDRNIVKENMGHIDFEMFTQHYRNARTPKQAEEYWSISPPKERV